jgi:hypothetical protein
MKIKLSELKKVIQEEKARVDEGSPYATSESQYFKMKKELEGAMSEAYYALQEAIDGTYDENFDITSALENIAENLGQYVR